jgi:hypothetical protein
MEVTKDNIHSLLGSRGDPARLVNNLRRVFAELVKPDADDTLLLVYTSEISQQLERQRPVPAAGRLGFASFPQACFTAGLIPSMFAVARNVDARVCGMNASLAGFHAVESVMFLSRLGTPAERRRCLDQILEQDGLTFALHVSLSDKQASTPFLKPDPHVRLETKQRPAYH